MCVLQWLAHGVVVLLKHDKADSWGRTHVRSAHVQRSSTLLTGPIVGPDGDGSAGAGGGVGEGGGEGSSGGVRCLRVMQGSTQ